MIAFDRYNVIVKGLSAKPLTHSMALLKIAFVWVMSGLWTVAPLFGWNRYVPEGNVRKRQLHLVVKIHSY